MSCIVSLCFQILCRVFGVLFNARELAKNWGTWSLHLVRGCRKGAGGGSCPFLPGRYGGPGVESENL